MGFRGALLGIALLVASGLSTASAEADAGHCPDLITGTAERLHPEGVAYSPQQNRFLVGSVTHGTVSVVQPRGSVRTLVDDPALITTMGLAVDARRGRLLVVNGDVDISDRSTPATIRKTAGLGIYDLRTGHRIAYHDLGALDPDRDHFGNDVAIARDGTAFVTDSFNGAVYQVPVHGRPSILIRDDRLMPAGRGNGANGIVLHPDGFLLIAHSSGHALYKLADGQLTQVTIDQEIGAPDGLLLDSNDTLHAVDNTAANRVLTLDSPDNWTTARLVDSQPWPDPAPTTMARGRCGIYVLSGRLDQLPNGSDEFLLRKLSAPPSHDELVPVVDLAAERILLADKVAAAKFGTTTPIEDPVREKQVLDQAAALAAEAGVDVSDTVTFFRAQIEMSKAVQRGLFDRWTRHPELAPTERPGLATEVRPELDRITVAFIDQLAATEDVRGPTPRCRTLLTVSEAKADFRYRLDRLHERALRGATRPLCT